MLVGWAGGRVQGCLGGSSGRHRDVAVRADGSDHGRAVHLVADEVGTSILVLERPQGPPMLELAE